jgi:ArsR family transcriptional regulator
MSKDECNVGHIVSKLKLPQSTVSLHLCRLKDVGVVMSKRKATNVCYSICDKNIKKIIKILLEEK